MKAFPWFLAAMLIIGAALLFASTGHAAPIRDPVAVTESEYDVGDPLTVILPWTPGTGEYWEVVQPKHFVDMGHGEGRCDDPRPGCQAQVTFYLKALSPGRERLRFELRAPGGQVVEINEVPVLVHARKPQR